MFQSICCFVCFNLFKTERNYKKWFMIFYLSLDFLWFPFVMRYIWDEECVWFGGWLAGFWIFSVVRLFGSLLLYYLITANSVVFLLVFTPLVASSSSQYSFIPYLPIPNLPPLLSKSPRKKILASSFSSP